MNHELIRCRVAAVIVVLGSLMFSAQAHANLDSDCVLRLAEQADGAMTLTELRQRCQTQSESESPGVVGQRLEADSEALARPFTLMAHHPNYILPVVVNTEQWNAGSAGIEAKDEEAQFQFSLKVPLAIGLLGDRMDIYAAYTNRSFWQVYDSENSRPFRETNHEPEIWTQFKNDWRVFGFTNSVNSFGFVHHSNGRGEEFSRSWNRVYANFIFERDHWAVSFKPWVWMRGDRDDSDNPDIDDYMGHGEWRVAYRRKGHVFSMMSRNQVESSFDRGALELSWSFPIFDYPYLKGYVQYFNGYGESLIDYDNKVNRLGIGISLTDWLY